MMASDSSFDDVEELSSQIEQIITWSQRDMFSVRDLIAHAAEDNEFLDEVASIKGVYTDCKWLNFAVNYLRICSDAEVDDSEEIVNKYLGYALYCLYKVWCEFSNTTPFTGEESNES